MTKAKIFEYLGRIVLLAVALAAFWFWSTAQVEKRVKAECALQYKNQQIYVMESQQKEAKNVELKKSAIYSRPNADRLQLLDAMRNGAL